MSAEAVDPLNECSQEVVGEEYVSGHSQQDPILLRNFRMFPYNHIDDTIGQEIWRIFRVERQSRNSGYSSCLQNE